MPSLPIPGVTPANWGYQLVEYLEVSHQDDGRLHVTPAGPIEYQPAGDVRQLFRPTDGQQMDIRVGTAASPDTTPHPPLKVTRTVEFPVTAGAGNGDSYPEPMASIYGLSYGTQDCAKNALGVLGVAKSECDLAVNNGGAIGVMGSAHAMSGSVAGAWGGYFEARREATSTSFVFGLELQVQNYDSDDTYNPTGYSHSAVIDLHTSGDPACFKVGVGLGFHRSDAAGPQLDVGIGFPSLNGGLVQGASIRDDGNATSSIVINGTHSFGIDFNGGTFTEVIRLPNNKPIWQRNAANSADLRLSYYTSTNAADLIPDATVINVFTDLALQGTNGTKIGTGTSQKLGFWGATPIVKPTGVAVTAAGIHAALVSMGLIAA